MFTQIIFHRKEALFRACVCITVLAMPIYVLRIPIFGFSVSLLDIGVVVSLSTWLYMQTSLRMSIKALQNYVQTWSKGFLYGSVLLFAGIFSGLFIHPPYVEKIGILVEWFMLPFLFAIVIGEALSAKKLRSKDVIVSYGISSLGITIIALGYLVSDNMTYDDRLRAFYLSANHLAMYIAPACIAMWFLGKDHISSLFKQKTKHDQIFVWSVFGALMLMLFVVLFYTFSYGAWIAVVLCIALGEVFFRNIKIQRVFVIMAGIILVGAFLFLSQWDNAKFQDNIALSERSSLASRIMIWNSAIDMIKDDWLWGIGMGTFQQQYLERQQYYPPYLEWAVPQPHNLYLAFWLQTGVLGLIGFLIMIFSWIIWQIKSVKSGLIDEKKLRITLLVMILSILLHGLVDTPYWKNDLSLLFWSVVFAGMLKK